MAYDPNKAAAYNSAIAKGLDEDAAMAAAGITDNEVYEYTVDETGSQNPQDRDYNPNYGKLVDPGSFNRNATDDQGDANESVLPTTSSERTIASYQTAGDDVQEGSDNTGTDTPVFEDQGDSAELSEEEIQNLDNPPNFGDQTDPGYVPASSLSEEEIQNLDNPPDFGEQTDPGYVPGQDSSITTLETVTVTASRLPEYTPVDNPLHEYATYTYNLSLFILTPKEYNDAMRNKSARWAQIGKCMIGGAGRYNTDTARAEQFRDDFYFSEFRMTTVIGMNARSKSSNAIDFNFTVIEPYGLTLLDRIIDYAHNSGVKSKDGKTPNYLEFPYLLKLDFFGSTDEGTMPNPIPNQSKYFPIRIISFKMKVGTKGTEYAIQASPFNHVGLQENVASCPVNIEVDAKTVGDFFDIGQIQSIEDNDKRELIKSFELALEDPSVRATPAAQEIYKNQVESLKKELKVKSSSYTAGVNDWYDFQVDTGARTFADKIEFVLDPRIANSTMILEERNTPSKTPVPDPKTVKAKVINQPNATGPDFTKGIFSISSGTSVLRLIDMVMRNSSYVQDQIADPSISSPQAIADKREKPLDWYKVIPSVELLEFDPKANRWAKKITYHIKEHKVYNSKHPMGPQAVPMGHVKVYNYMYTGSNTDIIDFSIDFDALYFTAVSVNRGSHTTIGGPTNTVERTGKVNEVSNPSNSKSLMQSMYVGVPDSPGSNAALDGNRDSITKTAASIQSSIYSSARGDMLNLRLKIIGDPHFIKQDDILINPADPAYDGKVAEQMIKDAGSLAMDRGEIFAQVNFFTPVDMDDDTGLTRVDGKFVESSFSGTYRVLKVDNEFRAGRFEQVLDMIRIFDDIIPAPSKKDRATQPDSTATTDDARRSVSDTSPDDYYYSDTPQSDPGEGALYNEQASVEDADSDLNPDISSYGEENEPWDPDSNNETSAAEDFNNDELAMIADGNSDIVTDDIDLYNEELAGSQDPVPVTTPGQADQIQAQADSSPATNDPVTGPVTTNKEIVQTVETTQTTGGDVTIRTADTNEQPTQESLVRDLEYDIFNTKRSLAFFTKRGNLAKISELNAKLASLESQLMKAQGQ